MPNIARASIGKTKEHPVFTTITPPLGFFLISNYLKKQPQLPTLIHDPRSETTEERIKSSYQLSFYYQLHFYKNHMEYLRAGDCCTTFPIDLKEVCQRKGRKGRMEIKFVSNRGAVPVRHAYS